MNKIFKNVLTLQPLTANLVKTATHSVIVLPFPKMYEAATYDGKNICLWISEKYEKDKSIDTKMEAVKKTAQLQ